MFGLFSSKNYLKLTVVKREYLERSIALVNTARKIRENPPKAGAPIDETEKWRGVLLDIDLFIEYATIRTENAPSKRKMDEQFQTAATSVLKYYRTKGYGLAVDEKQEEEMKLLEFGRATSNDKKSQEDIKETKEKIEKRAAHFEKGNVKLQVALKSPILDPVVTYENNVRSDGKFQMHFVKINEDASVDWLLLQLHIKRCIQSSANSHAYGQNIKKQSFFAEQVTAKSINLSKMVKTEAKDKVLTVIPERRWVLVIVPLAQAQQTFGNFWDTQNNPGSRYVTQKVFGDVDVYHPPQDKRLRGYLRDLVKGRLPVPPGLDVGSIRVVKLREDMQYGWKMELIDDKTTYPVDHISQTTPPGTTTTRSMQGASSSLLSLGSTKSTVVDSLGSDQTIVNPSLASRAVHPTSGSGTPLNPTRSFQKGAVPASASKPAGHSPSPATPTQAATASAAPSPTPASSTSPSIAKTVAPSPVANTPSPSKKGFFGRWFGGGSTTPTTPVTTSTMTGSSLTEFATLSTKKKRG